MDFAAALEDLNGRAPEHMPEPDLDRISELVSLLDHPELAYPSIQITGTNGKTTIAGLVTALACAHGLTTGTFISPHVISVTERLSVCGEAIPDGDFAEEYGRLRPYLELVDASVGRVTYFEALTGLAFLWFADAPVGLGVFEVGMGGRWDATNVVRGDVAVLGPVGLDHVGILGSTVAEIAAEKAGVIKRGCTALVLRQRPEAMEVIEARIREVGATMLLEDRDFGLDERTRAVGGQVLALHGPHGDYDDVAVSLHGEPPARGAAVAVAACEALLGRALDPTAVRQALGAARIPGRMEVAGLHPTVVLDGAHNPDAAAALAATLDESFAWETLHVVLGMFEDKDVERVLAALAPLAAAALVHVARPRGPRAADPARVGQAARAAGFAVGGEYDSVPAAVSAARAEAGEEDLILVTGSFYTVADARPLFLDA